MMAINGLDCRMLILNELSIFGSRNAFTMRRKAELMTTNYTVEKFNAALNDLMNEFKIMQVGVNCYSLC